MHKNLTKAFGAATNKPLKQTCLYCARITFSQLLLVTDTALKLDYGSAIFINFVSQINETQLHFFHHHSFCLQGLWLLCFMKTIP